MKAGFVMDAAGTDGILVPARLCSWSQDFLKAGGYSALLTRLNELLEVEWRYACVTIATTLCFSI